MELALREAKARLSELFKAASNGERAIITKQRRPVVELVPCNQRPGGIDFENWRKPTGNLALWVTGRTGQNNSTTRNSAGRFSAWTNDGISGSCRFSSTLLTCLTSWTSRAGFPSLSAEHCQRQVQHLCKCGIDLGNEDKVPCSLSSGHRKSHFSPVDVLKAIKRQNMKILHMSANHAACPLLVTPDHKGPFDELLLVQAQEEGLRLLTVDKMLVRQPLAICVEELEA
ncbi:MAG: type II toxin-antitoxin system prevent-host-death family antitoxin [Gammaproteobacteria bacterium]|nr:type II toxin-antitoxin system prevent-host-death family antitoxin [Gammaproteobacteria bacterium]